MKKLYFFLLCLYFIFIFASFNKEKPQSKTNNDLFIDVLDKTNGKVTEYGIKVIIKASDKGEKECIDILTGLKVYGINNSIMKYGDTYSIEFQSDKEAGYVQYSKHKNYGTITIEIVEHNGVFRLEELKKKIDAATDGRGERLKYFQYVKAKIEETNLRKTNEAIINLLEKNGAKDINTVELEHGFSNTALTGKYMQVKSGNEMIDFNCAVYSYESGDYVIIGTPIIMTSY